MSDSPVPSAPAFHSAAIAGPPRGAVLLVNLGTPQAPTAREVRRYLAEFLHDHRVVQLTRWLWCPLLHFVILPMRSPRVARKYAQVWMDGGSPLAVHTAGLADAVRQAMPGYRVAHAMRYGQPSVSAVLSDLRAEGLESVLVLPLYPQYSTTTTAAVADVLAGQPGLRLAMVDDYHRDAGWVAAVAASVRAAWAVHGRGEKLLFSFHGIPERLVAAGDPYEAQVRASVAALVDALQLGPDDYVLAFQSRFGREQWLQPATDATLRALGDAGVRRIDVVCPGFAVDCLETLEEISIENARIFAAHGGEQLHYIPCLNASPAHAAVLADIALRAMDGAANGAVSRGAAVAP